MGRRIHNRRMVAPNAPLPERDRLVYSSGNWAGGPAHHILPNSRGCPVQAPLGRARTITTRHRRRGGPLLTGKSHGLSSDADRNNRGGVPLLALVEKGPTRDTRTPVLGFLPRREAARKPAPVAPDWHACKYDSVNITLLCLSCHKLP